MNYTFDYKRFLRDNFRDVDGLLFAVQSQFSKSPNKEAVVKWFKRGTVSSEWLPAVYLAASDGSRGPDIRPYFEKASDNDIFA